MNLLLLHHLSLKKKALILMQILNRMVPELRSVVKINNKGRRIHPQKRQNRNKRY